MMLPQKKRIDSESNLQITDSQNLVWIGRMMQLGSGDRVRDHGHHESHPVYDRGQCRWGAFLLLVCEYSFGSLSAQSGHHESHPIRDCGSCRWGAFLLLVCEDGLRGRSRLIDSISTWFGIMVSLSLRSSGPKTHAEPRYCCVNGLVLIGSIDNVAVSIWAYHLLVIEAQPALNCSITSFEKDLGQKSITSTLSE